MQPTCLPRSSSSVLSATAAESPTTIVSSLRAAPDATRDALVTNDAVQLAERLVAAGPIPEVASADALHVGIAAVNGIDYFLTWNCKHLANAARRNQIEATIELAGHACPVICTPEELLEE